MQGYGEMWISGEIFGVSKRNVRILNYLCELIIFNLKTILYMKKSLLVLSLAAAAFTAQAETVVFIPDGSRDLYTGNGKVVTLPIGFNGITMPMAADGLSITWAKTADDVKNESYVTSGSFRWYADNQATITPAAGVTITKVTVRAQTTSYAGAIPGFVVSEDDALIQTFTGKLSTPTQLTPAKQVRCSWIEVEYDGTPAVAMPAIEPAEYLLAADQKVTINGNGAKVYYTLDGTTPTVENGRLYTEPFALESSAMVRAIAVKDNVNSFEAVKGYISVPAGMTTGYYYFRDVTTLDPKYTDADFVKDGSNFKIDVKDITFKAGDASFNTGATGTSARLYKSMTFGGFIQLRLYKKNAYTFSVPEDKYIAAIVNVGSVNNGMILPEGQTGTLKAIENVYYCGTSATNMWTAAEGEKLSVVKINQSDVAETQYSEHMYVLYADKSASGVDAIEVDNSNAPVEYFNLQGMRVNGDNLTPGIYVKRQGSKATKIYVK